MINTYLKYTANLDWGWLVSIDDTTTFPTTVVFNCSLGRVCAEGVSLIGWAEVTDAKVLAFLI